MTGWNYLSVKKSWFYTVGTGSWENIQSYAVGYVADFTDLFVSFQLIQLVKADPLEDYPNPFQRNGVRDFAINSGEWFVGEEFGKIVWKGLTSPSPTIDINSLQHNTAFKDFTIYGEVSAGDGSGNYTDALYFDPINEKYIFVGQLEATDIVGGTIDIANGTFSVDINGNMTATSGTFSGDIDVANINSANIDITEEVKIGDKLTLGSDSQNIQLERYNTDIYLNRNNTRLVKIFDNGLFVNGNINIPNGQTLGVFNYGIEGSTFSQLIYLSQSYIELSSGASVPVRIGDELQMQNNDIFDVNEIQANDFTPRTKTFINDMASLNFYSTADDTYNFVEKDLLNEHSEDIEMIYNKLKDLINALQSYNLI